jgi:hypothetical protein
VSSSQRARSRRMAEMLGKAGPRSTLGQSGYPYEWWRTVRFSGSKGHWWEEGAMGPQKAPFTFTYTHPDGTQETHSVDG